MSTDDPADLTAVDAAEAMAAGTLTSAALTAACLQRIAEQDNALHAWVHVDADHALAQARAADAAPRRTPLHGLPVAVKDIIDTADMPTSYGSRLYAGHRPPIDAGIVTRLRDAGAVVLGKTVTTEFALFHPGPTVNPHDPTRTPGGSSSGSAAAVAAGMVPLALGTQTAGSIVRPAAFCGIAGYKPTFGVLPVDGVKAVAPSLDTVGALARSVADLALLAGFDLPPADAGTPRVGFARTGWWDAAEPATQRALTDTAEMLALPTVELPAAFADLVAAQESVMGHEAHALLAPELQRGPVSTALRDLLSSGETVSRQQRDDALGLAARCREAFATLLARAGVEVLLVPAALGEAPPGLDRTGDPLFCRAWTLLGVPCVAVPGLQGPAGLPLGVQVVAAHGADAVALAAAQRVERALR